MQAEAIAKAAGPLPKTPMSRVSLIAPLTRDLM
jgi:hypothetical protein